MDTHLEPAHHGAPKANWAEVVRVAFVGILLVLFFLLGRSMVQHRFCAGGRVHDNGSIGQ